MKILLIAPNHDHCERLALLERLHNHHLEERLCAVHVPPRMDFESVGVEPTIDGILLEVERLLHSLSETRPVDVMILHRPEHLGRHALLHLARRMQLREASDHHEPPPDIFRESLSAGELLMSAEELGCQVNIEDMHSLMNEVALYLGEKKKHPYDKRAHLRHAPRNSLFKANVGHTGRPFARNSQPR